MEGLLIFGGVIAVLIFLGLCIASARRGWYEAKEKIERAKTVARVEAGEKPWGAPFAGSTYGDSYFLSTAQLRAQGLAAELDDMPGGCPQLGVHGDHGAKLECRVIFPRDGHLLTIAPTRQGKGVSHVIPNLLTYDGSVFVIDIKGENYALTGELHAIDHEVFAFDPFNESGKTARFNPLHFIRHGPDSFEDAQLIAELIVPHTGVKDNDFWDTEARDLVAGIIMYVALSNRSAEERTLSTVRGIVTMGETAFLNLLYDMNLSSSRFVTRMADAYLSMEPKVRSNVRTTAKSKTGFLDSERLEAAMNHSDFSFEQLKKRNTSIYIIIPPERLQTHKTLLRLMSGLAIAAMSREKTVPKVPVLFLLDEFLQMHRMERILGGLRYLAGYGVQFWIFIQDLPSLRDLYGHDAALAIIANCGCRIFFAVDDIETARLVSDMTGDMTILVESKSVSPVHGKLLEEHVSASYQLAGRRLLSPSEVLSLSRNAQLVFISGLKPILAGREPYYTSRAWEEAQHAIEYWRRKKAEEALPYISPYTQLKNR